MKLTALLAFVFLATPSLSHADLGGVESSIQQDQTIFHGSKTNFYHRSNYHVHEVALDRMALRQYVTLDGKVFAIAWKGPANPDLSTVLGKYFEDYKTAMQNSRRQRRGRAPIAIEHNGLRIELGGHMRAVHGRIWITGELPRGVEQGDIQ